jgi:hypothetical protein
MRTTMVISLKCPACQVNLNGENNSKVFFCHTCKKGYNVSEDKLHPFTLLYINPKEIKDMERIYFPFWQFESRYALQGRDAAGSDTAGDYMNTGIFYVPAFFIKNINYFGDIGFYYFKNNVLLEPGKRQNLEVFPADRDVNRAAQYPYIYMCKEHLKDGRGEFSDVAMKHQKASLVLVPFYKAGNYFYDSIISWKYPSGALI